MPKRVTFTSLPDREKENQKTSKKAMLRAVLVLVLVVSVFTQQLMVGDEWQRFLNLVQAMHGPFALNDASLVAEYGVSLAVNYGAIPKTCHATGKAAGCNTFGSLTSLRVTRPTRPVQSFWPALSAMSRLSRLELVGSAVGGDISELSPLSSLNRRLSQLTVVNTTVNGSLPVWMVSTAQLNFSGNPFVSRALPNDSSTSGPLTSCVLESSGFWVCPVPLWAGVYCSLDQANCRALVPVPPAPPAPSPAPANDHCRTVVPCVVDNSTAVAPECGLTQNLCQWSCCLVTCTDTPNPFDVFPFCAHALGPPDCADNFGCGIFGYYSLNGGNQTIEIRFERAVFGQALVVVVDRIAPG